MLRNLIVKSIAHTKKKKDGGTHLQLRIAHDLSSPFPKSQLNVYWKISKKDYDKHIKQWKQGPS